MTINSSKHAVIVDPTSSGALVAPELNNAGFRCIAVHTRPLPDNLAQSYVREHFVSEFFLHEDYAALKAELEPFAPQLIVAGNEPGVALSDRLAEDFAVVRNDSSLSRARYDKYWMQEAVRDAGLRAIRQFKSDRLDEILAWVNRHTTYPVMIKPDQSGGTDGVVRCDSPEMVASAFKGVLNRRNTFGFSNRNVLVQELVRGSEYVVNSVSCQGQHVLTEMGAYRKSFSQGGVPVYQEMRVKLPQTEAEHDVVAYNEAVLSALGVNAGPSHSEIMLTQDGPVLIETGIRLTGANIPRHMRRCMKFSQLDLYANAFANPKGFFDQVRGGQVQYKAASIYVLSWGRSGMITDTPGLAEIRNLPSCADVLWRAHVGKTIQPTSDLVSSPGFVYLAHESDAQLERDVARIEEIERTGALLRLAHDENGRARA